MKGGKSLRYLKNGKIVRVFDEHIKFVIWFHRIICFSNGEKLLKINNSFFNCAAKQITLKKFKLLLMQS